MEHLLVLLVVLPFIVLIGAIGAGQQRETRERQNAIINQGVKRAYEIAQHQKWVSPHRITTQCHVSKTIALIILRKAMGVGAIYQAVDGRYYVRSNYTINSGSDDDLDSALRGRSSILDQEDQIERYMQFILLNIRQNGKISLGALRTLGATQREAEALILIALKRGLVIKNEDGLYYTPHDSSSTGRDRQQKSRDSDRSNGGSQESHQDRERSAKTSGSDYKEALEILGIEDGCERDRADRAWKEQLKRNHPDLGGTTRVAQIINASWDTVRRHRGWD